MKTPAYPVSTGTRIYLNGFMGSGKSTLGPLVARRLGWAFSDLDERIVEVIGMPIAAYFQEIGEAGFRKVEAERLRTTANRDRLVVAVGGGALCREENLEWALQNGIVIFLRVDAGELARRLSAEQVTRPMLLKKDGSIMEEKVMRERIAFLLDAREQFYSKAHFIVKAGDASVEETVSRIVACLKTGDTT